MKHLACLLLLALSICAAAQEAEKVYRIGMLDTVPASANKANLNSFLKGMREHGYVQGKNLILDYRSADGRSERFRQLAAEMMRTKPDVIVTRGSTAAIAARDAGSVPVVMATSFDPIASGVVKNLARPGGHVTGLTQMTPELSVQRLRILKELVPEVTRVAVPLNMASPVSENERRQVERAAQSLGLQVLFFDVHDVEELNRALETAAKQGANALVISAEAVEMANRNIIIDFARKNRLPAMYAAREYVEAGGLISYSVDYAHLYYRAASYVGKILKGAKAGDLAIERPTKLSLVINIRAATAQGVAIPSPLLQRTTELIR